MLTLGYKELGLQITDFQRIQVKYTDMLFVTYAWNVLKIYALLKNVRLYIGSKLR